MSDIIASSQFLVVSETGEETAVLAQIGRPYEDNDGVWRCPVALTGLHQKLPDIGGEDPIQALCLAASLLRDLLEGVQEKGGRILHTSDRSEYSLDATFGRVGEPPRNPTHGKGL